MEGADPEDSNLNGTLQRGLNTRGAACYIGHSEGYLRKARRGLTSVPGPKFRRCGARVIYEKSFLDEWIESFPVEGGSC